MSLLGDSAQLFSSLTFFLSLPPSQVGTLNFYFTRSTKIAHAGSRKVPGIHSPHLRTPSPTLPTSPTTMAGVSPMSSESSGVSSRKSSSDNLLLDGRYCVSLISLPHYNKSAKEPNVFVIGFFQFLFVASTKIWINAWCERLSNNNPSFVSCKLCSSLSFSLKAFSVSTGDGGAYSQQNFSLKCFVFFISLFFHHFPNVSGFKKLYFPMLTGILTLYKINKNKLISIQYKYFLSFKISQVFIISNIW